MTATATHSRTAEAEATPAKTRGTGMLTLIAVFKLVKAALLVAVACGIVSLLRDGDPAPGAHAAERVSAVVGPHAAAHVEPILSALTPGNLQLFGIGALLYAGVFAIEGVGLWFGKSWAEYFTLFVTASFLPFEVVELVRRFTIVRVGALTSNVAVVLYLAWRTWTERHAART